MKQIFPMAVALVALCAAPMAAFSAESVETVTQQVAPPPGQQILNINQYDTNGDGRLDTSEVGAMLFRVFDTNFSGGLEPAEFENKSLLTVVPMEREVKVTRFSPEGIAMGTRTTLKTFMEETPLARFDRSRTGLSPHEFVGLSFADVDTNGDGIIDANEWRAAYMHMINPMR